MKFLDIQDIMSLLPVLRLKGWRVTWLQLQSWSCIHRFHGIRHFAFLPLFVVKTQREYAKVQGGDD